MTLAELVSLAVDKQQFRSISDYTDFSERYLGFVETGLQARIVAQNERRYEFFQYREDGNFSITRPLNADLMYDAAGFASAVGPFRHLLEQLRDAERPPDEQRATIIRMIYTLQQCLGAVLDALPAGKSNQARKINGDLFERLIALLISSVKVDCVAGTMQVPVKDDQGVVLFKANYQHDLLLRQDNEVKVIGSVKTSSKDRIDKVFMDKFLYSRLTETSLPHVAIFLNDVQRKATKRLNEYGISATFLPGHFKAYTIKLNPLDGVYYCDIRPNMVHDPLLARHIKTIDHFFYADLWEFLGRRGLPSEDVSISEEEAAPEI